MNTYTIQKDGSLALIEPVPVDEWDTLRVHLGAGPLQPETDPIVKSKRSYVKRGLTASNKSRPYQNARRRALQALKERHESEFEALFAEELKWYLG